MEEIILKIIPTDLKTDLVLVDGLCLKHDWGMIMQDKLDHQLLIIAEFGPFEKGDLILGGPGDEAHNQIWEWDGESYLSEEDDLKIIASNSKELTPNALIPMRIMSSVIEYFNLSQYQSLPDGYLKSRNPLEIKWDDEIILDAAFLRMNPDCKQVESCRKSLSGKCICPKSSATKGVIDLAMKEVSGDVRAPKVVRDGTLERDKEIDLSKAEKNFWYYQNGRAGSFMTCLFDAIQRADSGNQEKLRLGFPAEVSVVRKFRSESGYWEKLEEKFKN